jgi:hypothetical protein
MTVPLVKTSNVPTTGNFPVNKPSESVEHVPASESQTTTTPRPQNPTFFDAVNGKAEVGSGVGHLHQTDRCEVVMLLNLPICPRLIIRRYK